MEMMRAATQILPLDCELGEGVMWDARRRLIWFVDIKKHLLWRFDPATGEHASTTAPDQIGWVVAATDGRLLAGLKDGLHVFDVERGAFSKLVAPPGEPAHNRLNDACSHSPTPRIESALARPIWHASTSHNRACVSSSSGESTRQSR